MKLFYHDHDQDPELPDWIWALLCFKSLDVLSFRLYKMRNYSWQEFFSFSFNFFDYSLFQFCYTVGNWDGIVTLLDFSSSRSYSYKKYNEPLDTDE